MDLSNASVWWIAAGVAVAAELATGTFYLLMIALGLGAGALAAHFGVDASRSSSSSPPSSAAARPRSGTGAASRAPGRRCRRRSDRDVNLDIGERVHVLGLGRATAPRG